MYSWFVQAHSCTAVITCTAKGGDMEGTCNAVPALTLLSSLTVPHCTPVCGDTADDVHFGALDIMEASPF